MQPPIKFSTESEKNVTVILGSNTAGKTTIIQAFMWCLYEKYSFKPKDVINADALWDLMPNKFCEVFVEIVLFHEKKEFIIRRSQKFSLNANNNPKFDDTVFKINYKEASGNLLSIPANECKDTVKKILPEALSDYFFFDGERITDINNRGDVVAAVRGLMGLDVIAEARKRLDPKLSGSITSKLLSELDVGTDVKNAELKKLLKNNKDELALINERITEAKEQIEFFGRRKDELKEILSQNAQVKNLQKRRSDLEKDITAYERNIADSAKRMLENFRKGAVAFFALPLIKKAVSTIENAKLDGEGISEMRQGAVDHILRRGKCICGLDLNKNEDAVKIIKHERSLLPPEHLGTTLRNHKELLLNFQRDSESYIANIITDHRSWRRNINDLDDKKQDLKNTSEEITASGSIDIVQIESDYQKNEAALLDKQQLFEKLISDKGVLENKIEEGEKKIDSLVATSDKNKALQKKILYAETLFKTFDMSYLKREGEIKKNLLESVNEIFAKMYHGQRIVTIDNKYRITLLAQVASQQMNLDESRGLEAVKNFSFIAGLVDIARKNINKGESLGTEQDDIDVETEAYPLVMDAPFSNADEVHIKNISRIIPSIAEQIILIIMQKDWEYAKSALEDKVGKCYTIEKIEGSETNSVIREGE
jgi:DNA sulfur modification protein DndD